jgi:hypothetical protein
MNRYWIFAWQAYDDKPPLHGLVGDYDALDYAKVAANQWLINRHVDTVAILDTTTGEIHNNHICAHHRPEWRMSSIQDPGSHLQ